MKHTRLEKILELIEIYPIDTQEELQQRLYECGFEVTQATVSRDIKKLRLIKTQDENGRYRYIASKPESSANKGILSASIISIEAAMNDIVVKCNTGMAQAVCATIDAMNINLIIGTIAGDDTILIITKGEQQAISLKEQLLELCK